MTPKKNRPRRWGRIVSKTLLVVVTAAFVSPFVWMLFSALKPSNQVPSTGAALLGGTVHWDNFAEAFSSIPFGQIPVNTLTYALVGTLITMVVSVLNAYAFARLEFLGRSTLFSVFIVTLVLPAEVFAIPLFLGANAFGLVDFYPAIVLLFAFGASGTFMPRQFLLSLPGDYEEATRIGGAGQVKILFRVIIPLLHGPITAVVTFAFIDCWNAFLQSLIIISSTDKAPLQLGLFMFTGERDTDWRSLMAASTIAVLASLVIAVAMQKQLTKGLSIGEFGGR